MIPTQTGKIEDLSSKHGGWFLGNFVNDKRFNTSGVDHFETKWSKRKSGEIHQSDKPVDPEDNSSSLVILISGSMLQTMRGEEYKLESSGDYLFYSPNQPHSVEFLDDTTLLTIRWYK